jgi:hypothetical protein
VAAFAIQNPTVRTILENRIIDREVNRNGNATGKEKPFEAELNQESC